MIFTKELFDRAKETVDGRRMAAEAAAAARMQAFQAEAPEYADLRHIMIDAVKKAVASVELDPESAAKCVLEQQERNLRAQRDIRALLRAHGLPEDHLETKYTCSICSDTGYKDTGLCECMIKEIERLAFEEAGKKSPLRFCSFGDFQLDYYSDKADPTYGCSPRERAGQLLALCREYADDFDVSSPNLLMCGETGLGKTHLSLSIAGEVIKKGYTVLYNSAQNIFNELQKEYFGKGEARGQFEALALGCDLLIVDDLGAEFSTQFTDAALYNIINTRLNTRRPTIISTNLGLPELENRYTRRVSSRLIGEYLTLRFIGDDIRQIRSDIQ